MKNLVAFVEHLDEEMNAFMSRRWNNSANKDDKTKKQDPTATVPPPDLVDNGLDLEAQQQQQEAPETTITQPLLFSENNNTTTRRRPPPSVPTNFVKFNLLVNVEELDERRLLRTRRENLVIAGFVLACVLVFYIVLFFAELSFTFSPGSELLVGPCYLALGALMLYCTYRRQQGRFERLGPTGYYQYNVEWIERWYGLDSAAASLARFRLARAHQVLGQTELALVVMEEISPRNPRINTQVAGAIFHFQTGLLQYATGRYQDALESFTITARLRRNQHPQYPDQPLVATPTNILGRLFHKKPLAVPWYKVALVLQWVGQCHEQLGNYDDAVATYRDVIDEFNRRGFGKQMEKTKFYTRLARVYEKMDNDTLALEAWEEALKIHLLNEGDFPRSVAVAKVYVQLATLYQKRAKQQQHHSEEAAAKALEYYHEAVNVYRRSGRTEQDDPVVTNLMLTISDLEK